MIPNQCTTFIVPIKPLKLRFIDFLFSSIIIFFDPSLLIHGVPNVWKFWNHLPNGLYEVSYLPKNCFISQPTIFEDFQFKPGVDINLIQNREHIFSIIENTPFDGFCLYIEIITHNEVKPINSINDNTSWSHIYIKLFDDPVNLLVGDKIKTKMFVNVETRSNPQYHIEVTLKSESNPNLNNITKEFKWRADA